uniref:Transposase n=1 Tax=Schistosoma curassoni TaxID=6186 RepID=A0A183JR98_9TREM
MIIGIRDDLIFVLAERRASAVERKPRYGSGVVLGVKGMPELIPRGSLSGCGSNTWSFISH